MVSEGLLEGLDCGLGLAEVGEAGEQDLVLGGEVDELLRLGLDVEHLLADLGVVQRRERGVDEPVTGSVELLVGRLTTLADLGPRRASRW